MTAKKQTSPNLNHLKRAIKPHIGATLEDDSSARWCTYQIVAPDGKMWGGAGSVHLKVEWLRGDAEFKAEAIADAIERLEQEELADVYDEDDSEYDAFDWDTLPMPEPVKPSKPETILCFYRGGKDYKGRTLEQILAYDDKALEWHHDFIQVLFPLREASIFNVQAPVLDQATINAFQDDEGLQQALLRALDCMLAFYGFVRLAGGRIIKASNFDAKAKNWLTHGNHNFRRISRILQCLTLLGLPNQAGWFYCALIEVYNRNKTKIGYDRAVKWYNALQKTYRHG